MDSTCKSNEQTCVMSLCCRYLMILLLFWSNPASLCGQESKQAPTTSPAIRVNVNLVDVGVSVTDSSGRFVKGLRREDFKLFDSGSEQPITSFFSNEEAAQVVLLIEDSISDFLLAKLGKSPFSAADALLRGVSPSDRVAIVTYSDHAKIILDFTSDKLAARLALKDLNSRLLSPGAGSSALNLSESVAATINWLASVPGNKIIVLLSTGVDTSSSGSWQAVREQLEVSDVRILAVSIFGDFRKPGKKKLTPDDLAERAYVKQGIAEADQWLNELSSVTGGEIFVPKNAKDFPRAYAEIAQLVRGEYRLQFAPNRFDGGLHSVTVKTTHGHYRLGYRKAYRAPPSPGG
jgi:Ca-activated chloride channel family protein